MAAVVAIVDGLPLDEQLAAAVSPAPSRRREPSRAGAPFGERGGGGRCVDTSTC
jgi:hypothetical protein